MTMNNNVNEMINDDAMNFFEEVDEKTPISGPIRLPIDFKKARAEALPVILIGRGVTMSLVVLDKKNVGKLMAHRRASIEQGKFAVTMLNSLSSIIEQFVEKGLHMTVYTTSNNTILARTYRKYASSMDVLDVDAIVNKISSSNRYFKPEVDDTAERTEQKKESIAALRYFVKAMVNADAHGVYVEINNVHEFNTLVLNVPEDITIEAGDVLKFTNGMSEEGVTVQGWRNFNREKATVYSKVLDNRMVYFLYAKNQDKLTPIEQVIKDAIGKQWAECPNVEAKADFDSVEVVDFFN